MQRAIPGSDSLVGFIAIILPYAIAVILLSNYPAGGDIGYAALTFFSILFASVIVLILAGKRDHDIRWLENPEKSDWIYLILFPIKSGGKTIFYLPFGFVALILAGIFVAPIVPGSVGILLALSIGGIVLFYQLLKTNTVLIPWLTHFAYNTFAVSLAFFSIAPLSSSPIFIPELNFDGASLEVLGKEAAFQLIAVSLGEEMMKVSIAVGAYLLISKNKAVAIGLATALWVIVHTILSYRVALPF